MPFLFTRQNCFSHSLFYSLFSLYCKILVQKVLYISLLILVPAFLKTFYNCHRVSGVLISILYSWLPGYTLGFGLRMHMLILTFAFHSMHHHTISAFSILANFQPCPKIISNNINQLGLVNHHLVHSCLKLISNNIIQLGLASHPLPFLPLLIVLLSILPLLL